MQLFSKYYRKEVTKTLKNIVRKGSTIYEIGCRTGQLLSDFAPFYMELVSHQWAKAIPLPR